MSEICRIKPGSLSSKEALDFHCKSGTTILACEDCGHTLNFWGKYCVDDFGHNPDCVHASQSEAPPPPRPRSFLTRLRDAWQALTE